MSKASLTMALGPYEHIRDLQTGEVTVEGADLNFLNLPTLEIFHRMTERQEFDVSEMSFGRYAGLRAQGDDRLIALPIFLSRVFRHSSIFIRRDGAIREPSDFKGKRKIGVPEWSQTAAIYIRGWFMHEAGGRIEDVDWVLGGLNAPNAHAEPVNLPPHIRNRHVSDRSLNQMLLDGELDALFTASAPHGFGSKESKIVRLFPDFMAAEETFYRKTGIFPIMHIVCMRRDLAERHPWLPLNVLKAFELAKKNSLDRLKFPSMSRYALPWGNAYVARTRGIFGEDFWPYGVTANRRTLEAFVQYAYEQGVCRRLLTVEELFAAGAMDSSTFYSAQGEPAA
jgi:4,5-dihydroxyphthalate decarboxylase